MFIVGEQALILNMVSYAGRADMQVQVAKDIIPDPEFLAKCFEDALLEMKEQVTAKIWHLEKFDFVKCYNIAMNIEIHIITSNIIYIGITFTFLINVI